MGLLKRVLNEERKDQDASPASLLRKVRAAGSTVDLPTATPGKKKVNMPARPTPRPISGS
jgi:hypothetical protein